MSRRVLSMHATLGVVPIAAKDIVVCRIAVKLLGRRIKRAQKMLTSLDVPLPALAARDADCVNLTQHFQELSSQDTELPRSLVSSLRVGLSLEHDQVEGIRAKKEKLAVETDEEDTRLKQLNRLISALEVARLGGEAES